MQGKTLFRTLVAVDVVLVATFVVLLIVFSTSGGGGTPAASGSPTVSADAAPTDGGTAGPTTFRLPSGNIACAMSPDGVTCTIDSFTYAPPVVAGCSGQTGHVLTLDAEGVAFECETGGVPTVGSDVATLEYGSTSTAGDFTCRSATDGVTCTDGSGTGFRLARAAWSELP